MVETAAGTLTITPQWGDAKKRTHYNAFDLDRNEKGFVVPDSLLFVLGIASIVSLWS
jgi:hypothetical protein